jgi:hypothetical protein
VTVRDEGFSFIDTADKYSRRVHPSLFTHHWVSLSVHRTVVYQRSPDTLPKQKDSIELPIRTENTVILLYRTGFQVLNAIAKAVRPTLRLGHVDVKKVFGER